MEFLYELLFTVFFAFFFSLLVAKLVSIASTETTHISPSKAQRIVSADVEIERSFEGGTKMDEDGKVAHLTAEDGIYESVGGNGDRFESSGTVGEKTEENEVDDVAVERRWEEEVSKIEDLDDVDEEIEHLRVEDEIVGNFGGDCDRLESPGTICEKTEKTGVDDVAVEKRCEEVVKLEEFDDVEEEIEHLRVEDEIVGNFGGDCDRLESPGTICEKTEKTGVDDVAVEKRCEEVVKLEEFDDVEEEIEHLRVEDEIVGNFGGDCDRLESPGTICEKTEKTGVDDVAVEKRCEEVVKLEEFDDVEEEIEHLRVEDEIVGNFGGDCDRLESPGTICEKTEKTGVDDVAVEKRCEEVKLEELDEVEEEIEHLRVEDEIVGNFRGDCDSFESPGTICEKIENIGVDDVAVEKRCEEVKLEELDEVEEEIEHLRVEDEIVGNFRGDCDSFESPGTICEKIENIGVDEVAVERRFDEAKSEEFDGVGEVIAEHLKAEDEIVEDIRGDGDSFESLGTIGESIEKTVVDDVEVKRSEEVILEKFNDVDEKIVKDAGGVGDSFQSSGVIGENIHKYVGEGEISVEIGSSDHVDDVAVEQRSKMGKFVEQVWTTDDTFESSGPNNDITGSIWVETDIMVNSGRKNNHDVASEIAVGEKSDESELEEFEHKIGQHVGVDNVNSENSGTNVESFENVLVGGDIKYSSCNEVDDEDDDWEGIERSELEESFAAAANYVFNSDKNVSEPKLDSNVKMELYGLNKVALEGPCREAQPLAIMISSRAKWNAWQKLGNMTPEVAMEQYISLLSEKAPEWMEGKTSGDGSKYSSMALAFEASPPDISTYTEIQLNPIEARFCRVSELYSATDEEDLTVGSISVNKI